MCLSVHRCICVEKKNQLDVTECFIALLICSTCFGSYGLDGPGIESRWGRDFPPVQIGPGAHPASCTMGTGSFLGVKCGRDVLLTTHPLLVPWSWKSIAIPLPTIWATIGPVMGTFYQHVSGTSMPIIRSSRLYVSYYHLWCAVLGCWLSGVRCRVAGYASRKRDSAASLFLDA